MKILKQLKKIDKFGTPVELTFNGSWTILRALHLRRRDASGSSLPCQRRIEFFFFSRYLLISDNRKNVIFLRNKYIYAVVPPPRLNRSRHVSGPKTLAAFALGLMLFIVTLLLNIFALHIVKKYREQYE